MKAYWIARVTVTEPESYPDYITTARPAFERYGARFLARGGRIEALEGTSRERNVLIEFPDFESALACYNSAEYTEARAIRQAAAEADIIILEGLPD